MEEVWGKLDGYSNYEFSNLGRVRSLDHLSVDGRMIKGKMLRPFCNKNGYFESSFVSDDGIKKSLLIHRTVAEIFVSDFNKNKVVTLIDGDRKNIALSNLKIDNPADNMRYNTTIGVRQERHGRKFEKMTFVKEFFARKMIQEGVSLSEISKKLGVSNTCLSKMKVGLYDDNLDKKKRYAHEAITVYEEFEGLETKRYATLAKKYNKRNDWVKRRVDYGRKMKEEFLSIDID